MIGVLGVIHGHLGVNWLLKLLWILTNQRHELIIVVSRINICLTIHIMSLSLKSSSKGFKQFGFARSSIIVGVDEFKCLLCLGDGDDLIDTHHAVEIVEEDSQFGSIEGARVIPIISGKDLLDVGDDLLICNTHTIKIMSAIININFPPLLRFI